MIGRSERVYISPTQIITVHASTTDLYESTVPRSVLFFSVEDNKPCEFWSTSVVSRWQFLVIYNCNMVHKLSVNCHGFCENFLPDGRANKTVTSYLSRYLPAAGNQTSRKF